ncbi:hypothetical protein [Pedobacter metabolipauper]|uniref:Uncharacterized protein n=1 Tax=Pedobacter metabolipauper TaxID=425513 RepID=A0A4R6T198_9SPHI|nr:hypothetical protein [Pedobacter metabolipauper]TDQ12177.1 hypothetical protein ATK78_1310 [Pedobacter metabolipauper]
MNIIERLKQIAEENPNGFTVYTTDLQPVKSGWVVANKETQNCFGDDGLKKALEVAINTSQTLGGWKDKELFYWDAVIIHHNEEDATRSGIENGQIAIYQIETNTLKFL